MSLEVGQAWRVSHLHPQEGFSALLIIIWDTATTREHTNIRRQLICWSQEENKCSKHVCLELRCWYIVWETGRFKTTCQGNGTLKLGGMMTSLFARVTSVSQRAHWPYGLQPYSTFGPNVVNILTGGHWILLQNINYLQVWSQNKNVVLGIQRGGVERIKEWHGEWGGREAAGFLPCLLSVTFLVK